MHSPSSRFVRFNKSTAWFRVLRHNLSYYLADTITALVLTIIFVGIFVAESSGSVLSANIITDGVAVSARENCAVTRYSSWINNTDTNTALTYVDRCYSASTAMNGCNYLYNQSISYTEVSDNACPFSGDVCSTGLA